ncbi:hypothetical protein [Sulfobacillus harzensis]|uniref:Response regulatory domain-containing protein n=1 Tax=Sulfobacillus harzensis TaxID=2729629 RepID=A0A7Y0Q318_9FIRM|nr:hypothetical protein [Sulfobacillus harzensis]NMP21739.1 hypothetical protein [Sulfobacillus harzensis]
MMQIRVLLVDPSPTYSQVVPWELNGGVDLVVRGVSRGDQAIMLMSRWVPHLVIISINLSDMSAMKLAAEVERRFGIKAALMGMYKPEWLRQVKMPWIAKDRLTAQLLRQEALDLHQVGWQSEHQ